MAVSIETKSEEHEKHTFFGLLAIYLILEKHGNLERINFILILNFGVDRPY